MLKNAFMVVLAAALLIAPGVAVADPPDTPPGQDQNSGRLDLYEFDTTAEVEAVVAR